MFNLFKNTHIQKKIQVPVLTRAQSPSTWKSNIFGKLNTPSKESRNSNGGENDASVCFVASNIIVNQ